MEPRKEVSRMVVNINDVINDIVTDPYTLRQGYIYRDGFVFREGQQYPSIFNRIFIRKPERAKIDESTRGFADRTLEEHIELINMYKIEKAHIICDNLDFILECPSLNDIVVWPSLDADEKFDYSVLYKMPWIKRLSCKIRYGELEQHKATLDFSKVAGLENITMYGDGYRGYDLVQNLKTLWISENKKIRSFQGLSCSPVLKEVTFLGCGLRSLEGIDNHKMIKSLTLWHNYSLTDISALADISESLTELSIDACSKIKDFSVLSKLENLEYLQLDGNNILPNLDFLKNMKKLKIFGFRMNVADGDLSNCMKIPYVFCKNRKHYNFKDKDLPKNRDVFEEEYAE